MKTTVFIIFISFIGLNAQKNTLLNDSTFNDLYSVVFNKDSIAKYTYEEFVLPLRSYLYPNNTGLSDDELFKRYKAYQKAKKEGMKFEEPEIHRPILLEAKFRRILGKNPYKYLEAGKIVYEYEVTNVLLDEYNFYKIGDKIKVFEQDPFNQYENEPLNERCSNYIILNMYEKAMYDNDKFRHSVVDDVDWFGDLLYIMKDLYATDSYYEIDITKKGNHEVFQNHTYEEFKKKCKETKARMNDKSKPYFWYDYKLDEKQVKGE